MSFGQILFSFRGRLGRLAYFGYSVLSYFLVVLLAVGGMSALSVTEGAGKALGIIVVLLSMVGGFWMGLALMSKRLHDLGLSGVHCIWFFVLNFISSAVAARTPELGILFGVAALCAVLWLLFAPGQSHANEYGPPWNAASTPVTA